MAAPCPFGIAHITASRYANKRNTSPPPHLGSVKEQSAMRRFFFGLFSLYLCVTTVTTLRGRHHPCTHVETKRADPAASVTSENQRRRRPLNLYSSLPVLFLFFSTTSFCFPHPYSNALSDIMNGRLLSFGARVQYPIQRQKKARPLFEGLTGPFKSAASRRSGCSAKQPRHSTSKTAWVP